MSLTSFPPRISQVHIVVASILTQRPSPEKVVLYLAEADFPGRVLPRSLTALTSSRFDIRFVERDLRPYLKLLPALSDFPGKIIVTCDDDIFYPQGWLAALQRAASETPGAIVCCGARRLSTTAAGDFAPYLEWHFNREPQFKTWIEQVPGATSFWLLPLGRWGIWYPPGLLDERARAEGTYLSLMPTNDDIGLRVLSWLAGVPCRWVELKFPRKSNLTYESNVLLSQTNVVEFGNDRHVPALFRHYGITAARLEALERGARGEAPG